MSQSTPLFDIRSWDRTHKVRINPFRVKTRSEMSGLTLTHSGCTIFVIVSSCASYRPRPLSTFDFLLYENRSVCLFASKPLAFACFYILKNIMVQVGMVSPADKKMGSGGSLLGSSFGIELQSPPSLSYNNEVATLYINDFKSAWKIFILHWLMSRVATS